ncbi:MAG: nucleotide sugar dehydrogenase [Pseudomonadota bacterium]
MHYDKTAIICVVGMGYVGLPLAIRFLEEGFYVFGLDVDAKKVEMLERHESYIEHIGNATLSQYSAQFTPTKNASVVAQSDVVIMCVPTPLNVHREPDLSFVMNTLNALKPHFKTNQLLSLESTTYPGTTEEKIRPVIEASGFHVGADYFLVYSPEREDPGNTEYSTRTIPKICAGATASCLERGMALYGHIIDHVVPVSSTQTAELTKLLENIHRAVNIGLVNEMKMIADKMGIDVYEVIDAAATKPFGFVPYYPGPGLGGHCIPIDPFYLTWKAREYGVNTRFIELAGEINDSMPSWVVNKLTAALNERQRSVNGSRVLILGIAYKKNVDDMRESPSVNIMQCLTELGAQVEYSDPHVPVFPMMRAHYFDRQSRPLTKDELESYDCVLLATDHDQFDYELIEQHSRLIIDTRGKFLRDLAHVIRA